MRGVLIGLLLSTAAGAQTPAPQATTTAPAEADIIVTATRRAERLQDVPVSVSAFTQEKLDKQALRGIDDLARFTPGVTFTRNGLSGNYNDASNSIAIRGIDSSAGAATTGVYIDDTPIQSRRIGFGTQNAYPALFDLERVEVLRGPQGTLFGAGSEGGTVRFLAPPASLTDMSTYGRLEAAGTERGGASYEAGFATGGPLVRDRLGIRLGGSYRRDGGYVDRVDPVTGVLIEPHSNYSETATLRVALKWQPTDRLTVQPSFYWQEASLNDTGAYWAENPALSNRRRGIFRNGNRLNNRNEDPFWLAALRLDYDFGWAQLTSNTSYFKRRNRAQADYTQFDRALFLNSSIAPPGAYGVAPFTDFQDNFYQEARLQSGDSRSRFQWTAGVFYARLIENSTEYVIDPTIDTESGGALGCTPVTCPGGTTYFQPLFKVVDKQLAGFGEARLKVTNTLAVAAGVRVSDVRYTTSSFIYGQFFGGTVRDRQSGSETPVTPRAVLSWQPNRDTLVYASAAKGFRVGGVNAPLTSLCAGDLGTLGLAGAPPTYASDSLWSYEAGVKASGLGRRLTVNASGFVVDWSDIQQNVYLPTCGLQFTANLGQVRSVGGDLEIAARPTDALTLGLTVAYTDAYYTRPSGYAGGAPIVSRGDRLRGSPWSLVASAEYRFGDEIRHQPYLRADYQLSTRLTKLNPTLNPANALSDVTLTNVPTQENVNLRAGLRLDTIDISAFVQNVTNDLPVLYRTRDVAYEGSLYFERSVRPRTYGLTVTVRR